MMETKLKKHFLFLIVLSVILSVFTSQISHMNNWLIFRSSFFHLLSGESLYQLYPTEHIDLFKYSPTFALFMAPLSLLPPWVGGVLWNLSGALLFILALHKLPLADSTKKGAFWVSLPEFIGSTQGFQSNIHMVALLALFWIALEHKQSLRASLMLLASFFIKIFGVIALSLVIFRNYSLGDRKFFAKFALSLILCTLALTLLPLLVISWDSLVYQYSEWARLLKMDAGQSYGFSLMGVAHAITGADFSPLPFQVAGGLSLVGAFTIHQGNGPQARLLGLIALCYFMVVFNHKSESPTFIIAMVAFGLHQSLILNQRLRWGLIVFTLGCVSLMYSDLFRSIKQSHLDVYCVKVWPFLLLYPMALFHGGTKKPTLRTKSVH